MEEKEEKIEVFEEISIKSDETAEEIINGNAEEKLSEKDYEENFKAMLRRTSFGTELREALERIAEGESGALIVLADPEKLKGLMLGGFKVNCKFSGERIFELAKMDGAIVIDPHLKKIYYANVLLIPSPEMPSRETGTRHQAAERTAKQTGQLVIAVSERTSAITLYTKYFKYKLKSIGSLITRLQSVLDSLEVQKKIFTSQINYLNILEFTNLVTSMHVISPIQKAEILMRGNKIAKRYLTELGAEGDMLELRLKEIMKRVDEDYLNLLRDYGKKSPLMIRKELSKISYDDLINIEFLSKSLGFDTIEDNCESKGFRMLSRIPGLTSEQIKAINSACPNLMEILNVNLEDLRLIKIVEKDAGKIKDELEKLKNSAMLNQGI